MSAPRFPAGTLPSQGDRPTPFDPRVEGHVTRVKLIKRMMYGKAGFALLRQRILHRI